jgi:hypothetical protein
MHFSFCTISAATPTLSPKGLAGSLPPVFTHDRRVHEVHEPAYGKAGEREQLRELALLIAVRTLGPAPASAAMHHAGRGRGGD